ncbi:unnamed protein product [Cylindrotheca closterium]|uniref:Tryptophan synthase beta chain-like PALP domain-containing protein n=1 Tax=Cylindrotheca closterium TaxID=2856 RepID=A0AAD2CRZ4_9STRA|nr:unnamed protein product [Cylindrotheca closterium]
MAQPKPKPQAQVLPDVTAAIGSTPLVNLSRLTKHYDLQGRILAKLEYLNPGFSKKDRIAKHMIEDAKTSGQLQPGQPVVELTSGNTGTGLAIVCGVLGHPFTAVMSKGNSMERARMMNALGATVELVEQAPGSKIGQVTGVDLEMVEQRTNELVQELGAFRADQFRNQANAMAHFQATAPEIWNDSGNSVTSFCDFVGTGGSFGGCARYFQDKGVKCYIVEPKGAAVLAGGTVARPNHRIQGGGYLMKNLPCIQSNDDDHADIKVDGYLQVTDEEAIQCACDLARLEGIFGGFSAGANVAAAIALLRSKPIADPDETIAILICDSGLKYLSTDLWEEF